MRSLAGLLDKLTHKRRQIRLRSIALKTRQRLLRVVHIRSSGTLQVKIRNRVCKWSPAGLDGLVQFVHWSIYRWRRSAKLAFHLGQVNLQNLLKLRNYHHLPLLPSTGEYRIVYLREVLQNKKNGYQAGPVQHVLFSTPMTLWNALSVPLNVLQKSWRTAGRVWPAEKKACLMSSGPVASVVVLRPAAPPLDCICFTCKGFGFSFFFLSSGLFVMCLHRLLSYCSLHFRLVFRRPLFCGSLCFVCFSCAWDACQIACIYKRMHDYFVKLDRAC